MLLIDKAREALKNLRKQIKKDFTNGHPYSTVSINHIKKEFDLNRKSAIDFIVDQLDEEYRVGKDGNWLILEQEE